jgi:hypothetical protein
MELSTKHFIPSTTTYVIFIVQKSEHIEWLFLFAFTNAILWLKEKKREEIWLWIWSEHDTIHHSAKSGNKNRKKARRIMQKLSQHFFFCWLNAITKGT